MNADKHSDTPIYDSLIAKHTKSTTEASVPAAESVPVVAPALGSQALLEAHTVTSSQHPETAQSKEKKLLTLQDYSIGTQDIIKTINNAILDGERSIRGESFVAYINGHKPFITVNEFPRLIREVRAL